MNELGSSSRGATRTTWFAGFAAIAVVLGWACGSPDRSFAPDTSGGGGEMGGSSTHTTAHGPSSSASSGGKATSSTTASASSATGQGGATSTTTATGGSGGATSTTATGGGTTSAGGSAPTCETDGTHVCVPPAPPGWSGPAVIDVEATSGMLAGCPGDFPTTQQVMFGDLTADPADCTCTCPGVSGIQCTASTGICGFGSANLCNVTNCLTPQATIAPNTCIANPGLTAVYERASDPAPTTVGTCDAPMATSDVPAATWAEAVQACGGASTTHTGCDVGEVCAPGAFAPFGTMCISAPGDQMCPNSYFADKRSYYNNLQDTRACTDCTCSDPVSHCGGDIAITQGCGVLVVFDGSFNTGTCEPQSSCSGCSSGTSLSYHPSPTGTCTANGGQAEGTATPTGGVTFCCH